MIDKRPGEFLWSEWFGEGYETSRLNPIVFYTEDHVDLDIDVIKRALASAVQRDGSVDSLSEAFHLVERGKITHAYAGELDGEVYLTICDENGETEYGDTVDQIISITVVEL
jgi:hypothetical protein